MTKVVRRPSPTAAVPAPASAPTPIGERKTHAITDERGRRVELKKLTALDRMRLALLVGGEASENASFMQYASLAASVTAIDGEPKILAGRRELDALVGQLDEDGCGAVLSGWIEAGWVNNTRGGAAPEAENEHAEATKNS